MLCVPAAKGHLYPKEVKDARIYTCVLLLLDKLPLNSLVLQPVSKLSILKQSPKELRVTVELVAAFTSFPQDQNCSSPLRKTSTKELCAACKHLSTEIA